MNELFISKKKGYRKIWEEHHQMEIPKDENGRSYEIHHIDGNRNNNHPDNLLLVTIEEHYKIHFDQGDFYACIRIAQRMGITPEDRSLLAKLNAEKQVEMGTHPFQDSERNRENALKRIDEGTHHLLGGVIQKESNKKRIEEKTHHWLKENRSKTKTGDFTSERSSALAKERLDNGTHNLLTNNPSKTKWRCEVTGKVSTKTGFTTMAKKLGSEKWPHKLIKII